MEEKYMVNDLLNDTKNFIKIYTDCIIETENMELRNVLQTLRNALESFEYDLVKISESKGYLSVTETAEKIEIEKVKANLNI